MVRRSNDGIIVKSNYLVEAPCRLTITEQKIIYLILNMIDKEDKDFKDYIFTVADFMDRLDLKGQSAYSQLKATTRLLRSRTFTVRYEDDNGDRHELQTGWVSDADYNDNKGTVTFYLSKKLKPFLLQLKEYFTVLELDNLIQLKSIYSTKIYELLKQYKKIGDRTFALQDLKEKLAIDKKSYDIYNNLKQKVILVAQEEINEKTDIFFDFEEIKKGRKVVALKFYIYSNKKEAASADEKVAPDIVPGQISIKEYLEEQAATIDDGYDLVDQVVKITEGKLSKASIKTLLKAANNDVEKIKEKYILAQGAGNIENLGKWLHSAIKDDYKANNSSASAGKVIKKGNFNNFKSRFDEDPGYAEKVKEAIKKKNNIIGDL